MERGQCVLVDTMVIVEAHRVGCWNALAKTFKLETVERCLIECATGNRMRKGYVPLDASKLRSELTANPVTVEMISKLIAQAPFAASIDPGEQELIAYLVTQAPMPVLSTCDKAAIRTMHLLRIVDLVVTLEDAARIAGRNKLDLSREHTGKWLSEFRLKLELGIL